MKIHDIDRKSYCYSRKKLHKMVDPIDICKICLRTDVKLKEIDKILLDYHYVVTDFALFHIDSRLCSECEYLLRKSYNFNQKCVKAAKILQLWHRNVIFGKTNRKPLSILHTQVPQLSLSVYRQENIETCAHIESTTNLIEEDFISEINESNIKKNIEFLPEAQNNLVTVKVEETDTFHEVLIQSDNGLERDDIELVNEDDTGQNDGINDVSDDASVSSDDEFLAVKKLRSNQEFDETKVNNSKEDKKRRLTRKIHRNINCNEIKINNSREVVKRRVTRKIHKNKYDDEHYDDEHYDDEINCDDDETKINNSKEFCDIEVTKSEKYVVTKLQNMNKDLNTIYKDWEQMSLTHLPVITVSKDDSTTKRSLAKKRSSEKEDVRGQKGKRSVVAKLVNLSADLDSISEDCGRLINYKEGLINPIERLRAELTSKFASCGELKTEDGFVVDKETIMRCFDRVSECLMRRLWRFLHGRPSFEPRAINTLKHIQNKYQNEYQYETVFSIEYLNTKEKVQEEFEKRRTYDCYLNAKYRCEICYLGFKYEAQMENHKQSHEESAGQYGCGTCGVRHKSKRSLDTHSKSHEAVYKCRLCPLVTYYRYSMMNHYNQHEGKEYRCEPCDITFRSKSAYKTHCGLRHGAGDKVCTTCGRALATERALACHLARHKRDSPATGSPVPCAPCNLTFASQQAYLRHARTAHSTAAHTKQKAIEDLPKKKPVHICRVCNEVGSSIGWLTLHFRLEHPTVDMALTYADKQLHLCEICGKGYTNVYNLRDHLAIHAGVRAHACPACGARFHRAVSLAQHRLTHLPPRRACPACGKRFHSQSNLNNHMRGHSGDRRYKCSLCGKGFLHRNALNEHVRGVHHKLRRARQRARIPDTRAPPSAPPPRIP